MFESGDESGNKSGKRTGASVDADANRDDVTYHAEHRPDKGAEESMDGGAAFSISGLVSGFMKDSFQFRTSWSRSSWDLRSLTRLGVVLVVLTVCSWLGIALSRQSGGVATIWLSNGILFGLVITQPRKRWLAYFAVGLIADTSADVFWGDGFWLALGVSVANSFEVITSCVVLTRIFGHPFNLSRRRPLLGFLGVSVVCAAALTSAMGATWTMLWQDAGPWLQLFRTWYLGDMLGMALMAPLTFMLQREDFFSILHPARLANTLLLLLVPAAATLLVFSHNGDPLIFFLFPALMLIVFKLGFPGTVTTIFVVALLSIGMTVKGHGPLMLITGEHAMLHRIVVDQIFLAVAIFTLFPVAALLEERAALQLCLEASEARYRSLATLDELTGLANRRAFNQRLSEEMQSEQEIALLLIDADLFKRYNDHYGHMMGDECLQAVAEAISGAATLSDAFVSRFGGEEFAVILPGTGLQQGRAIAEQIRTAVVEMQLPHPSTQIGYQTVSIGVSASTAAGQGRAADLIGQADMALYRAKDLGRNRVVAG
ncbi:diguanylate cyclase (GGDEF)-like protein [Granulicella aggregans]|uniref:diguanylate cyclase n=1 Tax=Granulicella aggregans TaxID=474949 RepID=A0A7W8E388_9BACT|nr:diguanylate cyclase [Granulicella aggregans]MBB5057332.1 diguanylate cyclase (GGDEF)-like protein [Granulicella aggregans]